jgi:hypothetical protein
MNNPVMDYIIEFLQTGDIYAEPLNDRVLKVIIDDSLVYITFSNVEIPDWERNDES